MRITPKSPINRIQWYLRQVGRVTAIKVNSPRKLRRMTRLVAYKLAMNKRLEAVIAEGRGAVSC